MSDLAPGSAEECASFAALQESLGPLFARLLPDPRAPRTVLVNPSLSLDAEIIAKVTGLLHYEERLLCMLMLLRLPRTRIVFVSSMPVESSILDYYLHLLPGIPGFHARRRLVMLSCHDPSVTETLTEKLLARPRMLDRIRTAVGDPSLAHMTCFNVAPAERTLAVRLGIPIFGNDPALEQLGSKSGSRHVFRAAGVRMPPGHEDLRDERDIAAALAELKAREPSLRRAAVKLDYGASGEGNATFSFEGLPADVRPRSLEAELPERLRFEQPGLDWAQYRAKFRTMGGVVEAWIDGEVKHSPSVQCRITPLRAVEVISTHDQILGGPSQQVFLGCTFPARSEYRRDIQEMGHRVAQVLRDRAALGRLGIDFVSVLRAGNWSHYAIEINLRKGGTTHTFRILQFLTGGVCDRETGRLMTESGEPRCYHATDNLHDERYRLLSVDDVIDAAVDHELLFDHTTQEGVFFHLLGALSAYGKLGVVCVARDRASAGHLFRRTVEILDATAACGIAAT